MDDDNVQIGRVESSQGRKEICGTSLQIFVVTQRDNPRKLTEIRLFACREQPATQSRDWYCGLSAANHDQPRAGCVMAAEHAGGRLSRIVLRRIRPRNFHRADEAFDVFQRTPAMTQQHWPLIHQ